MSDYLPTIELAPLSDACREAMASDLMAAFARPVPGKPVMLVSRDWVALYLRDEVRRLEGEIEDADQAADAARVEVRGLTGNARGQATRRADRAAADAYAARRELDAVRAVLRQFGLEEVTEAAGRPRRSRARPRAAANAELGRGATSDHRQRLTGRRRAGSGGAGSAAGWRRSTKPGGRRCCPGLDRLARR